MDMADVVMVVVITAVIMAVTTDGAILVMATVMDMVTVMVGDMGDTIHLITTRLITQVIQDTQDTMKDLHMVRGTQIILAELTVVREG